jgi:hypothetical protein
LQIFRFVFGREALNDLTLAVDQELGEVPFDALGTEDSRGGLFQVSKQRVSVRAVDIQLGV